MEINQNESNLLKKIKNKYILKNLFEYVSYEKLINVIKFNKDIQNRLDITKDTYKKYSKIELEIILKEEEYGTFINIHDYYKHYFHIYFNANKEEIKVYSIKKKIK